MMDKAKNYGYTILGKDVRASNDTRETHLSNNLLVVGTTGSGKTGSVLYPNLKALNGASMVVVDTKGRLCAMFEKELKKKGYEVLTLDFVTPENSCRYNPLDYIRKNADGSYREQDIAKIAASLMPVDFFGKDPFWAQSARLVLEFIISFCLEALPDELHDIYSVSRLYRAFAKDGADEGFTDWLDANPSSFAKTRYDQIMALRVADRTLSSVFGFVNVALFPFDVREYRHIFESVKSEENIGARVLDISRLGKKRTVLFLNISDSDHSADALVNLFYTQLLQTLIATADRNPDGTLDVPVSVCIDDFASGTVIPDFDKIISVVRSRNIWVSMFIQSISQLESLYSKAVATTIINNCSRILYLGSNDLETAKFIGTRARKTPDTILAMDVTKEYLIEGGQPAVLINKVPPYSYEEEPTAKRRPKAAPKEAEYA